MHAAQNDANSDALQHEVENAAESTKSETQHDNASTDAEQKELEKEIDSQKRARDAEAGDPTAKRQKVDTSSMKLNS